MFDVVSYILGFTKGKSEGEKTVILEGDGYTFTDANTDGNIVITKEG